MQVQVLLPGKVQNVVQRVSSEQAMVALVATGSCRSDTRSPSVNRELGVTTTNPTPLQALRTQLLVRDLQQDSVPCQGATPGAVAKRADNLLELVDYYL